MKKTLTTSLFLTICILIFSQTNENKWKLIFQEDFNGSKFNTEKWGYSTRQKSDWNRYLKNSSKTVEVKNGLLYLRAIKNPEPTSDDKVPYWTGGIETKRKFSFKYGKIEVRAKFTKQGEGGWKAIWLMPENGTGGWPKCGEIDIMEHLNSDNKIYQTIHSHYATTLNIKNNPPYSKTANINRYGYNIYGLEWSKDELKFLVNGNTTFTYPRIETDKEGQWPFDKNFYIILNQAAGGSWVGAVKDSDLPFETVIDWVKVYKNSDENEQIPEWESDKPQNDPHWKDTYLSKITTENGINSIDYSVDKRPESYYVKISDTLIVNSNTNFTLNLVANSIGKYNETKILQDLRYTAAYIYTDFEETQNLQLLKPIIGDIPPKNNIGGNYNVLNISKIIKTPNLQKDDIKHIRVVYNNAFSNRYNVNSAVKEGLVYDFTLKVLANNTSVYRNKPYNIELIRDANNSVIVKNLIGINNIKIFDIMGKLLSELKTDNPKAIINLNNKIQFVIVKIDNNFGQRYVGKIM